MYYQNLFNQEFINQQYYMQMQQQFTYNQNQEIAKMIKALNDFMDAANQIAPQYQQQAMCECILTICNRAYPNNI